MPPKFRNTPSLKPSPSITVKEINQLEEWDHLKTVWNTLLSETPAATFFHSPEWLKIYLKHYGVGKKIRILIIYSFDRPLGILPLYIETLTKKVGTFRCLTYPFNFWGSFYGPIGPNPYDTLVAGLKHICQTPRDWDLLELRYIHPIDREQGITEKAMQQVGLQTYRSFMKDTSIIDLEGTWDSYLANHTSKWRNNLKRWQRKLEEKGRITYIRYRPLGAQRGEEDPRWDLYNACEEIAKKSWQESSQTGTTLSHASVRPFLREVHAAAAQKGTLDLNLLLVNERPAAFVYNYYFQGNLYGLRIGYDQEISRDGTGNLLYTYIIKDSFNRGDLTYDLGPDALECKEQFKSCIEPIIKFSHYSPWVLRAQLIRLKRVLVNRMDLSRDPH